MHALPQNLTLLDSGHENERPRQPGVLLFCWLFHSLSLNLNTPEQPPRPTAVFLGPSHPDLLCFCTACCTDLPCPGAPASWPPSVPSCPEGRQIRSIAARGLPLHVKGRFRHLLSMKCGFQYILWKQKQKSHLRSLLQKQSLSTEMSS